MQKTDLNVSPYYDDYAEASNFHRVLFRPAFSVQARELTQMQSILQNQIEKFGSHFFKEGATVVPGQSGFDLTYSYVTLQATFTDSNSVVHTIENYRTSLVGMKLTGATSGVIAKVLNTTAATTDDALTLFVKYESCGTESGGTTNFVFSDGESITSDSALSYSTGGTTYTIAANLQVGTTSASDAAGTGSAASVQAGVFYIRGTFVAAQTQTLILDKYSNRPSYRVGFTITESLVSPEEDTALLDNATGSSNYAAKGAHRLKYILTLTKKVLGSSDDADFIQLMSIKNGQLESQVRSTEYSVLEETLARRTYDESGDYVVRGFNIDLREHLNTGLNDGVYTEAEGGLENKVAIGLSPGKAYVRGYEITTISQTFVALEKGRTTQSVQNYSTTFNAGNYVQVENVHGMPEIADFDSDTLPFKTVELINQRLPVTHMSTAGINSSATSVAVDSLERFPTAVGFHIKIDDEILKVSGISGTTLTVTRGQLGTTAVAHLENAKVTGWGINPRITPNSRANTVGVSKSRAFEVKIGSAGTGTNNHMWSTTSRWQHYLFDVRMLVKLTFSAANKFTSSNFLHNGARIKGSVSGATGYVYIPPQDVEFDILNCQMTSGDATITMVNTGGLTVGMGVSGTGIPNDTYGMTTRSVRMYVKGI